MTALPRDCGDLQLASRLRCAPDMLTHYTVKVRGDLAPFLDDQAARWLWEHMRDVFPDVLAFTIMLDHLHAVMEAGRKRRLAALIGAFAREHGFGELWLPIDEGRPLTSIDKVQRACRYVALNPCRPCRVRGRMVKLVDDPLRWLWSTHRDVVGAVAEPWVTASRLGDVFRWNSDVAERWHAYVSADPEVSVTGTPFPQQAWEGDLQRLQMAACAATRSPLHAVRRPGPARSAFVSLGRCSGWRTRQLAERADTAPRSVPRTAAACPPQWLEAAALCLGDARLIQPWRASGDEMGHGRQNEGSLAAGRRGSSPKAGYGVEA